MVDKLGIIAMSWSWTPDLILVDLLGLRKGAVVCLDYDTIFKVMTIDWAYDQHEWLSIIISSLQKKSIPHEIFQQCALKSLVK